VESRARRADRQRGEAEPHPCAGRQFRRRVLPGRNGAWRVDLSSSPAPPFFRSPRASGFRR